jgi:lipopolysaccharide export system permease protein
MTEAQKAGLTPLDIARLVPFIVPSSLPYTMPVALLFSVCVIYGRLAGDNEVIAVKTAGLSAMKVLMPSFMVGGGLSFLLLAVCNKHIPEASHEAKKIVFANVEDYFYKMLKKEREFNNPNWPFYIKVRDVEGKTLLDAYFKHRAGGPQHPNQFDLIVHAKRATVSFDLDKNVCTAFLVGSECTGSATHPDFLFIDGRTLELQIPGGSRFGNLEPRIQELTKTQIIARQAELLKMIENERKRQAMGAALWVASGRIGRVDWPHVHAAFRDYHRWTREYDELETEKQMRIALACGSLFFVLVGAPVGIKFARRDFMSAFITCFLPIIGVYYPLTLLGLNMGKEGLISPAIALWAGNCLLAVASGLVLPSIMQH